MVGFVFVSCTAVENQGQSYFHLVYSIRLDIEQRIEGMIHSSCTAGSDNLKKQNCHAVFVTSAVVTT